MADLQLFCAYCQFGYLWPKPDTEGDSYSVCPRCGRRQIIPPAGRGGYRLNMGSTVSGEKLCPSCKVGMPADAVFCTRCGFSLKTGRRYRGPRRWGAPVKAFVWSTAGVVLGLAVVIGWRWYEGDIAWAAIGIGQSAPALTEFNSLTDTNSPTSPGAPNLLSRILGSDPAQFPNQEQFAQSVRRALTERMDLECPLFAGGETVMVRRTTGQITRGLYQSATNNTIGLLVDGQLVTVRMAELDANSRLRCDVDYRARQIEAQVNRRVSQRRF